MRGTRARTACLCERRPPEVPTGQLSKGQATEDQGLGLQAVRQIEPWAREAQGPGKPVSAALGFARADGAAQRCRGPPRTKLAWHGLHRVIFDGVASIHLNLHQLAKSRDLSRRTVKRLIVRAARVARDARAEKWRVALQRAGLRTPLGEPPRDPFSLAVFCLPARERAVLFLARLQECTQTRARLFSAERSPVTAQPAFGHLRRLTCRRLRRQRRHVCTSR